MDESPSQGREKTATWQLVTNGQLCFARDRGSYHISRPQTSLKTSQTTKINRNIPTLDKDQAGRDGIPQTSDKYEKFPGWNPKNEVDRNVTGRRERKQAVGCLCSCFAIQNDKKSKEHSRREKRKQLIGWLIAFGLYPFETGEMKGERGYNEDEERRITTLTRRRANDLLAREDSFFCRFYWVERGIFGNRSGRRKTREWQPGRADHMIQASDGFLWLVFPPGGRQSRLWHVELRELINCARRKEEKRLQGRWLD